MPNPTGPAIAIPTGHRRLQLVCSGGELRGAVPILLRPVQPEQPMPAWDAQLQSIIRRVIKAMSEAHPSTLIEELLGPLRQLHLEGLPDNTDDLVTRIAREIRLALLHLGADRGAVRQAALRWLARMESNGREPARLQYRELLSLLG